MVGSCRRKLHYMNSEKKKKEKYESEVDKVVEGRGRDVTEVNDSDLTWNGSR